jgi:hypothetical protein
MLSLDLRSARNPDQAIFSAAQPVCPSPVTILSLITATVPSSTSVAIHSSPHAFHTKLRPVPPSLAVQGTLPVQTTRLSRPVEREERR